MAKNVRMRYSTLCTGFFEKTMRSAVKTEMAARARNMY
jgi:hypothetical protein